MAQGAVRGGKVKISGNTSRLAQLMALRDEFPRLFELVEPKRAPVTWRAQARRSPRPDRRR